MNMGKRTFLFIFIFLVFCVLNVFPDYVITVKVKDEWDETKIIHHEGVRHEEGHWIYIPPTYEAFWKVDRVWYDPEPYDETIIVHHPAEFKEYMVSGGIDPQDLASLVSGFNQGGSLDVQVDEVEGVPGYLNGQSGNATQHLDSIDTLMTQLENDSIEYQRNSEAATNISNSGKTGDPVRVTVGENVQEFTDFEYSHTGQTIRINRIYGSNNTSSHSLGTGWTFNYDTRIILGDKPKAREEYDFIVEKKTQVSNILSESVQRYNTAMGTIDSVIQQTNGIIAQIQTAIAALQNINTTGLHEKIIERINSDLVNAQGKLLIASSFLVRAGIAKTNLQAGYDNNISYQQSLLNIIEQKRIQSQKELAFTLSTSVKNKYVFNGTDDDSLRFTGRGTLTCIDEAGIPRLYKLDRLPDYDSNERYENGEINYFPNGASASSVLPNDDTLELNPDGSYTLQKKDKTQYFYSLYGQLENIINANGNKARFLYSSNHELVEILDDFNRSSTIQRINGKITKITDPAGRIYVYSYDGGGNLSSVTDAEGDEVRYDYSGNLLTRIIKPDDSYRQYFYESINGKTITTQTVDEEGNSEYFRYYPQQKYTEYENPSGIVERHYYDDRNRETKITYPDNSSVEMAYDNDNNLIMRQDELGNVWRYEYDNRRNMTKRTDPDLNTEEWTYNNFSKVTSYKDKRGYITQYDYDVKGNLLSITYPDYSTDTYTYDNYGLVVSRTDRNGNTSYYAYDDYGNLASVTDPEGNETAITSDIIGNVLTVVDPEENTTAYEYNNDNKVTMVTDPAGYTQTYEYNNRKDLTKVTDKNGNATLFNYDKRHLLMSAVNPLSETVEYAYRGDGKMTEKIINGLNHTTYAYDMRGNLSEKTQVETGTTTSFEYDAAGRAIRTIDPNCNIAEYGYDALGRFEWAKDPVGNTQFLDYDENGNRISLTDRIGNTTDYDYDALNRLTRITDPLNNSIAYAYDPVGNLTGTDDKNGNHYAYEYDRVNRLLQAIDPMGNNERFEYNGRGLVTSKTDKNGNLTHYTYDELSRLVAAENPLGGTRAYDYDPIGNLIRKTDENGNTVAFAYDPLNRVIKKTNAYGNETIYAYNYLGQVAATTDALGNANTFAYDELGRLLSETDPLGAVKTYDYDNNSNLVSFADKMNRQKTFTYDALNRLVTGTNALGEETTYAYDATGNLTEETSPDGIPYRYEYNELNRLVKEINRLGNEQDYAYDPMGNLTQKTDFNHNATAYDYDPLNRLSHTHFADGTAKTFTYDPAGNIVEAVNDAAELTYQYDALNRLATARDVIANETQQYAYDPAGNRLSLTRVETDRTMQYTYGKMNELLSVTDPDGNATTFAYDPLLRETTKILPSGVTTETTYDPAGRINRILNTGREPYGQEKKLSSEAYLYNAAGQRTYTLTNDGDITAYAYDPVGRVEEVLYPFSSGKKIIDFRERLDVGLYPELPAPDNGKDKNGKKNGKDNDNENRFRNNLPGITGEGNEQLTDELKNLLNDHEDLYRAQRGYGDDKKLYWGMGPGPNAASFAERLSLSPEAEEALDAVYEEIAPRHHKRLDTDQWMWTETFAYDSRNNRASKTNGWGEITYAYNEANEIFSAGERAYEHDANGNLVKELVGSAVKEYTYSPENRITEIKSPIPDFLRDRPEPKINGIQYAYDAFGRRMSRSAWEEKEKHGQLDRFWEEKTNYLYDGLGFDILAELGNNEHGNNGGKDKDDDRYDHGNGPKFQPVTEYLYANGNIVSSTELKYERSHGYEQHWKGNDPLYYHRDILGSTMMLTDERGNAKDQYSYDAFGNMFDDVGYGFGYGHDGHAPGAREATQYLYTGKRLDPATGLYDYGFRDYDPQLARFTTVDPIQDSSNWYAYVGNEPVNLVDLLGLCIDSSNSIISYEKWTASITEVGGALSFAGKQNESFALSGSSYSATVKNSETGEMGTGNFVSWTIEMQGQGINASLGLSLGHLTASLPKGTSVTEALESLQGDATIYNTSVGPISINKITGEPWSGGSAGGSFGFGVSQTEQTVRSILVNVIPESIKGAEDAERETQRLILEGSSGSLVR